MTTSTTPVALGLDARFIAELGRKSAEAQTISIDTSSLDDAGLPTDVPLIWDPERGALISLHGEINKYRLLPREKTGIARALTLDSFIDLVNRHKTPDTAVFANTEWTKPSFTAVVDYHPASPEEDGAPAHNCRHRIQYDFPLSEEWKAWVEKDGQPMSQLDFAAFLEDRIADLSSPTDAERNEVGRDFATTVATPADLMQLSRGLSVHVNSAVKTNHILQTGAGEIQWVEQHMDGDGKPLVVPGMFMLGIAPFFMGEKARIPVRLRYRVSGNKVIWFYQIYRPDVHVTERVRTDLDNVVRETALPAYEGTPETGA